MLVWRQWSVVRGAYGVSQTVKEYKLLLLFGILPIFISING